MKCVILIASHKKYWMPEDKMYLPIQVGAAGEPDLGYIRDDTGDNISVRNKNYCELTGLYWAWKNLDADYLGLAHYRRHFTMKGNKGDKTERVISSAQIESLLSKCDVLLPKVRNYYIETNYGQYVHAHHAQDLDRTRQILSEKYPDYLPAFDACMKRKFGHRFNMFVMKWDILDRYCQWLFDILFELERRLDISAYNAYDARVFGFVGERMLDVWLKKNGVDSMDIPYIFMEKQNWIVKGGRFLKRKLCYKDADFVS